ncbi:MAG: hypothetical protein CMK00_08015 [Planctomycetes bacterium]|jgi:hypothetical protein|nr:hypothetical protein [Planctomycetota bacterium]HJO25843.1 hypothetical protein [Planctomycetota bacterium]
MRKLIIALWFMAPVALYAYHMGPGQELLNTDDAAALIESAGSHARAAEELAATEGDAAARPEWAAAEADYAAALTLLPAEQVAETRRLRLERAKAQMFISQLPTANSSLASLVQELRAGAETGDKTHTTLLADAQSAYASSQYYMTWLMRLEGAPREEWEPRIESARQTFKQLAGDASGAARQEAQEDLESAIRLARMDLTELQGLPLPSQ